VIHHSPIHTKFDDYSPHYSGRDVTHHGCFYVHTLARCRQLRVSGFRVSPRGGSVVPSMQSILGLTHTGRVAPV
jgi:hypothetical protein